MSQVQGVSTVSESVAGGMPASGLMVLGDYVSLTKPRIILLLLISTYCPMVLASGGEVFSAVVFWTLLGGALTAGSACAMNCVFDRDIDAVMRRTKGRPIPTGRISPVAAVCFSAAIGFLGIAIFFVLVNPLSAVVAFVGHAVYIFVYTIWLKRSTPQNIVIGGIAGAIPPVVGWVAVTGSVDIIGLLLFLVIFLWTPPHFWALALNKSADYERAGVPMLPVIAGEHATCRQMLSYALCLFAITLLLVTANPHLEWFSFVCMLSLGLIFISKLFELKRLTAADSPLRSRIAWNVFGFSIVYLALVFLCLVVDSTIV